MPIPPPVVAIRQHKGLDASIWMIQKISELQRAAQPANSWMQKCPVLQTHAFCKCHQQVCQACIFFVHEIELVLKQQIRNVCAPQWTYFQQKDKKKEEKHESLVCNFLGGDQGVNFAEIWQSCPRKFMYN